MRQALLAVLVLAVGARSAGSVPAPHVWPGATITLSDLTGGSGYHEAVLQAAGAWNSAGAGVRFVVRRAPGGDVRVVYRHAACVPEPGASASLGFVPGANVTLRACPSVVRPLLVAHELGRVLGLPDDDRACGVMNSYGKSDRVAVAIPGRCTQWAPPAWLPRLVDPVAEDRLRQLYRSPAGVTDVAFAASSLRVSWRQPPGSGAYRTVVIRDSPTCPRAHDAATLTGTVLYDRRAFSGLHSAVDRELPPVRTSYCYGVFNVSATGRVTTQPRFVTFVFDVPPTAAFAFAPPEPVAGAAVGFTDGSTDPDGSIVRWHWDFGDPASGDADIVDTTDPIAGRAPQHTFTTPGTYTVTLTVTDDGAKTASAAAQVTVR